MNDLYAILRQETEEEKDHSQRVKNVRRTIVSGRRRSERPLSGDGGRKDNFRQKRPLIVCFFMIAAMAEWFVGPIMDKIINTCFDYLQDLVGQTGMKEALERL
ncbi:hypothetical protein M5K25_009919 [Dendrobium thyrsiflorum]|uniref:Uncharacterized protein n=1 Tax=Dendrobium thyrsiflorum TaxID=117978 RepID=A0ABD0V710_DENTH